jgi:hypothetical protein
MVSQFRTTRWGWLGALTGEMGDPIVWATHSSLLFPKVIHLILQLMSEPSHAGQEISNGVFTP